MFYVPKFIFSLIFIYISLPFAVDEEKTTDSLTFVMLCINRCDNYFENKEIYRLIDYK